MTPNVEPQLPKLGASKKEVEKWAKNKNKLDYRFYQKDSAIKMDYRPGRVNFFFDERDVLVKITKG